MKKEFCVTSDIYDDFLFCKTILTESHIEDMMRYASSLGATRFEWILDTLWNIYEKTGPVKYDLLKVACDSAHRNGMRFDVVYKPFESGLYSSLPFSFPHSAGDRIIKNENGIVHSVRKFVAENPQYRIARRKGDGEDPGGRLAEIRLVKFDENEIQFSPDDISFWYSSTNGNFKKYEGKLETSVSKEWKLYYPYDDKLSTLLSFKGFDLPEDVKYVEVRCNKLRKNGSFSNHIESIVELVNDRSETIPSAPSTINPDPKKMYTTAKNISDLGITDYLNKPEVKELLKDFETFNKHFEENCKGMYRFEPQWEIFTIDSENTGVICVCRGKPMQHPGALHPIYPEVRQSWLDDIQYCIDRGVDGVNIRISRHGGMNEPWAYGFNDPVIEKLKKKDDVYEAAVVNGKAFDAFMEDAADLLHKNGKEIGVHLCGFILRAADRKMATTKPSNFVWNWERWVREIVDYTEFHKTNFFKFHNAREIIDHFGYVVTEAGKPFIYQSGQSGAVTHYEKPHRFLAFEMDWVKNHPHITCYNLYETASVFKINQNGVYEGSPHIRDLVKDNWE
jgi:hypothetical protein